jgi:predicted TIM-barrel fold metal-dependent hydrolase
VDGLIASFDEIASGMREILSSFPAHEQRAFFHGNAVRIYEMEKR